MTQISRVLRSPRALRLAAAAAVVGALFVAPATRSSAAGLLDRWWDDLTGTKPSGAPTAVVSAAKPPPATTGTARPGPAAAGATPAAPAPHPAVAQAAAPAAPPIPVVLPQTQTLAETLTITGNAASVAEVKLIARVVGFLEKIHFEDGAIVRKGDLLFTIQQDQYTAQLQQAQAQLQLQQAALLYAHTEVGRYTALLKKDAATQVDVDHWVFEQSSAEANIAAAKAQIAIAELNLGYTEIRAPFDGLMGKHLIDVGNVVGGNGQQAALADIQQLDPIYIVANISTQQAQQIQANLQGRRLTLEELHQVPVDVQFPGEDGFPHRGTMQYVADTIDPQTGTLFLRAILRNPNRAILPGVFANMRLPLGKTLQSALLIPVRALQEDQGGRYALVVNGDGVIEKRYVQLGPVQGAMQVVTGGIAAGDRIVVGDLWRAAPGMKVTTTTAAAQ